MAGRDGIDRRDAMKVAMAGLAIGGLYHTQAQAQDEAHDGAEGTMERDEAPLAPGWRTVVIGEAKVTQVLDGVRQGDGPHPIFGENREAGEVEALMEANGLPANRFVNFFQPTIVEIGSDIVLVDTGFGAEGRANGQGLLVPRLRAAGYEPEDITTVFLTHYHGDHIAGLSENGSPTFPNAELVAGRVEHEFWTSDAARSGPASGNAEAVAAKVLPLEEGMRLLDDGEEVVPGLTARAAFGHTPGMMMLELVSGEGRLFLTADVFGQFVVSLQRPDWHVRFDMDKEAAAATRRRVAAMLAAEGASFAGYHLPFPAIGTVAEDGEGYRFVPESYRLLL